MTREKATESLKRGLDLELPWDLHEALPIAIKSLEAWGKIDLVARQRSLKKDTWELNGGFVAYVINLLLEIEEESEETT